MVFALMGIGLLFLVWERKTKNTTDDEMVSFMWGAVTILWAGIAALGVLTVDSWEFHVNRLDKINSEIAITIDTLNDAGVNLEKEMKSVNQLDEKVIYNKWNSVSIEIPNLINKNKESEELLDELNIQIGEYNERNDTMKSMYPFMKSISYVLSFDVLFKEDLSLMREHGIEEWGNQND